MPHHLTLRPQKKPAGCRCCWDVPIPHFRSWSHAGFDSMRIFLIFSKSAPIPKKPDSCETRRSLRSRNRSHCRISPTLSQLPRFTYLVPQSPCVHTLDLPLEPSHPTGEHGRLLLSPPRFWNRLPDLARSPFRLVHVVRNIPIPRRP